MRWLILTIIFYIIFRITKPLLAIFFLKKEINKNQKKIKLDKELITWISKMLNMKIIEI